MFFFLETYGVYLQKKCTKFKEWMCTVPDHKHCQDSGESVPVFKIILIAFQKLSLSRNQKSEGNCIFNF